MSKKISPQDCLWQLKGISIFLGILKSWFEGIEISYKSWVVLLIPPGTCLKIYLFRNLEIDKFSTRFSKKCSWLNQNQNSKSMINFSEPAEMLKFCMIFRKKEKIVQNVMLNVNATMQKNELFDLSQKKVWEMLKCSRTSKFFCVIWTELLLI